MPERKRFSRHIASTIKGLNNCAHSNHSGRSLQTSDRLDRIFETISNTPISLCSTDCPLFKNDICSVTGSVAPVGENCIAQEHSRERSDK